MLDGIFQMGHVVNDLDAAISSWIDALDVGPFFVREGLGFDELLYRGTPATLEVRVALCQIGDMQLELIQQTSAGPSVFRDSVPKGHDGIHHVAKFSSAFDADLKKYSEAGIALATVGVANSGTRIAYLDTRASLSCMLELIDIETASGTLDFFAAVAAAARDWNGEDPVRHG